MLTPRLLHVLPLGAVVKPRGHVVVAVLSTSASCVGRPAILHGGLLLPAIGRPRIISPLTKHQPVLQTTRRSSTERSTLW